MDALAHARRTARHSGPRTPCPARAAFACTHSALGRAFRGAIRRIANEMVAASDCADRCRLQARRKSRRAAFQLIPPGKPADPHRYPRGGRKSAAPRRTDVALVSDAPARPAGPSQRRCRTAARRRARRKAYCDEVAGLRWRKWAAGRGPTGCNRTRRRSMSGGLMGELNSIHAGRRHPGGGRRIRRALGRALFRQPRRPAGILYRRPRLCLDRLRPARLDGRAACRARPARRRAHRRRRFST